MPAHTVKIDRSTVWGNPFKVDEMVKHPTTGKPITVRNKQDAISLFTLFLETSEGKAISQRAKNELAGFNLACWCKCGDACHGDVLLMVANETSRSRKAA